jgi:hypothetical protein
MRPGMKYNAIEEERKWWDKGETESIRPKPLPAGHYFAHSTIRSRLYDTLLACLLHHLVGQGDLGTYLKEFVRVTKPGGYVIALEPNIFNHSGLLMNIFNSIKPGITGLVPHERALSPLYLVKVFREAGLEEVECVSASYVWNRFPLFISRLISKHEGQIRLKKPFNLFGWFEIIYGRKANARAFENST